MKKIFINARIKELRKALKLNQTEFGARIGLKNGAISKMEQEGSTVTEQNIKLICEKFNVRREWLTEGTGDMLRETEDSMFASFAEHYKLDGQEAALAKYLLGLTSEDRQNVLRYILSMADALRAAAADAPAAPPAPTAEERAAYERVKAYNAAMGGAGDGCFTDEDAPPELHRKLDEAYKKKAEWLASLQASGESTDAG